tara:strand:+ start:13435 stop:13842 length:408 start_codon:yes stop_codon:yes gene_type:complete
MNKEYLNIMDEFLLSSLKEGNTAAVDSILQENGYDLSEINSISNKSFKRISFEIKAQLNLRKDERLLDKVSTYFKEALEKNTEKPISYLRQLVSYNQVTFQHRNLEKLSQEEIKGIIRDYNLLEILEKLEGEEEL